MRRNRFPVDMVAVFAAAALVACSSPGNTIPSGEGGEDGCGGEGGTPWDGTTAKVFACGSGIERRPYVIMTAEQLAHLSFVVNSGNKDFSGKHFKLGADIMLNEGALLDAEGKLAVDPDSLFDWTPIGNAGIAFDGVFDGGGHVVSGMFIDATGPNNGLFGSVSGTVRNVTVEDSWVRGGKYTGGIVGKNVGTVENATNRAAVTGTEDCVGGVVGRSEKRTFQENSVLKNLLNEGPVSGKRNVGGVAGSVYQVTVNGAKNIVKVEGIDAVGGVFGSISGISKNELNDLVNSGEVSGENFVGGIAGAFGGSLHIYDGGNTSFGCLKETFLTSGSGKVDRAKNTGEIFGKDFVSGVFGALCNAETEELANVGRIEGERYVSGVVGSSGYSTTRKMYNVGDVSGSVFVGGIFAENQEGVTNAAYSAGEVSGDSLVGLMIGYGYGVTIADYYYLRRGEQAPFGLNDGGGEATSKTEAEMKDAGFVELLGDGFVRSDSANGGLPVFAWETE